MKTIIILFCFFLVACVTNGPKARSVASTKCTIENYQDFVFPHNLIIKPIKCDLRGAMLWYADLRHADLREADLREADLRWADLREADLRNADLRHADLREADLQGADLRGAKVTLAQAKYLRGQGLTGFIVMSDKCQNSYKLCLL